MLESYKTITIERKRPIAVPVRAWTSRRCWTWYERVRRPLPWRETRDPYALLVSEVMLQQTQALRVVPYYERWLARFPSVDALAGAPTRDVLALWSGLGYNRRALALQRAAAVVAESGWPADLTALPGVGPYTAAAVGSFAWDRQVAAVDTNVRRVLERRDGVVRTPRELGARGRAVPAGRAATFNQAMMELGATVCRPRAPRAGRARSRAGCHGPLPVAPRRRGAVALRGHRPLGARAGARRAARRGRAAGAGRTSRARAGRARARRAVVRGRDGSSVLAVTCPARALS